MVWTGHIHLGVVNRNEITKRVNVDSEGVKESWDTQIFRSLEKEIK
jgi:hypothetical protein